MGFRVPLQRPVPGGFGSFLAEKGEKLCLLRIRNKLIDFEVAEGGKNASGNRAKGQRCFSHQLN